MWSWRKSFSIPSVAILYSFLSTPTQTWDFWEEGTHTEKMAPIRSNLQTRLEVGLFWITDCCGKAQHTVGGAELHEKWNKEAMRASQEAAC